MYKREFQPLHPSHNMQVQKEKPKTRVVDEKPDCKDVEAYYVGKIKEFEKETAELRLKVSDLEKEREKLMREKEELLREREKLTGQIKQKDTEREIIKDVCERVGESLKEMLLGAQSAVREEILVKAVELAKKLLLSNYLPKEDVLFRALRKVLESDIELKGQVNLFLSPADLERIEPHIRLLREKLGDAVQLSVFVKEGLNDGEFIIETQKLWIERRYEELLHDLAEMMEDDRSVQSISQDLQG
ncbi:MAG: FliH/SctL family protein [Aquificaceae bacterium]|nr:FliH/SctL family protein [Aquificaceae bacterium]